MAELKNTITSVESTAKVTSTITESTNLNGTVEVEKDGMKQTVLTMSCSLTQNTVANIQTYVTNMDLFLANSQLVQSEVLKFREKATQVGKGLNCFVF
ncbi:hypothetical protein KLF46_14010 (plasmid) [Clostridium perfringens]|uniref:hypothetical protein n=1 Tax=Clostridium perfringens TaxID=1502 RepID=UPI001CCAE99D|nr:hypothetical protein [Clostridium perfringens]UBK67545.1 hypothetical protein KLF46_14010 [Clostridium perfringens]